MLTIITSIITVILLSMQIFGEWNKGELDSFLIEITRDILKFKDEKGEYLVEKIRDTAGQKGTGKWTAISALDYGMPVTLIGKSSDICSLKINYCDTK